MGVVTTVRFRPMTGDDLPTVLALETTVYPDPWSEAVFREEIARHDRVYLVAEEGDLVVGFAGLLLVEHDAHVTTVAVDPASRGRGLGTRLMLALADAALESGAAHLTLEVRVSNTAARRLYERFGFEPVGRRKDYYRTEDALVMWATDIDTPEYRERLDDIRRELA